jgi:NAD(P)-dependent dehydrogenase (short-subunit alcohol dehydrogenase family)
MATAPAAPVLPPISSFPNASERTQSYLGKLFGLDGKIAVVIGGTGVLCGEMASTLANVGADVVIVGRSQEKADAKLKQIKDEGGKASFIAADVLKRDELQKLCDQVVKEKGRVDILINGAGVNSPTPFFNITDEEFDRIIETNLASVLRACQIFGAQMLKQEDGGCIINIGSMAGLNPASRVFTYSASKAAVHNLSANLAREWALKKIRVNTLVPGFFPAEQNRKILDASRVASIMGHTPMQRFGNPQELNGALLLLTSNVAGGFITGSELVVDGGFNHFTI